MKKFLLSFAAAVCAFGLSAQDGAPLYATGDFEASNWAPEAPVEFAWDGTNYTITIENFTSVKVSTVMGDWDSFNAGALCLESNVKEPGTYDLIEGDGNILMPWKGDWTLTVAGDLTQITLATTTPIPVGFTEIYMRGGMNEWGVDPAWQFSTVDGNIYILNDVVVEEGVEFKIADADWATVNYGSAVPLMLDEEVVLDYNGSNITVDYEGEAIETVSFKFNLDEGTVIMSTEAFEAGAPAPEDVLYITGDFPEDGWNATTPREFGWNGTAYTFTEFCQSIKISTSCGDWDLFNEGALTLEANPDGPGTYDLIAGDANITFPWQGDWTIVVSADLTKVTFSTTTEKPDEPTAVYVRGAMNEWGADDAWKFSSTDGVIYTLKGVTIEEGVEFKIADANWGLINYGSSVPVMIDEEVVLDYNGDNITVDYEGEEVGAVDLTFNLAEGTLYMTIAGEGVKGDANGDGLVDATDIAKMIAYMLGETTSLSFGNADIDVNGEIDATDIAKVIAIMLGE